MKFEKSYITDCEGPLTLNDNAYELCEHFIEDGGELFKILSKYDDYLADVVKLPGYKAGNTLILILPFLSSYSSSLSFILSLFFLLPCKFNTLTFTSFTSKSDIFFTSSF